MYQLTKREKVLLFALSIVVLVVAGFSLLINPLLNARLNLQRQLGDEQVSQAGMMADLADAAGAAQQRETAKQEAQTIGQTFYAPMNNTQLSNLVASFLDLHGLTGVSMSLSGITVQDLAGVQPTLEAASSYAWNDLIQGNTTVEEPADAVPQEGQDAAQTAQVLCNTITISGTGEEAGLRSLLTDLAGRTPIRVQSFSVDSTGQFTLELSVYMLDVIP